MATVLAPRAAPPRPVHHPDDALGHADHQLPGRTRRLHHPGPRRPPRPGHLLARPGHHPPVPAARRRGAGLRPLCPVLAAPFLAITFWAQLRIMAPAIPPHAPQDPHEPFYALIAQLIGWSAIIVA